MASVKRSVSNKPKPKSNPPIEHAPERAINPLEKLLIKIQIWQAKMRIQKLKKERERKGNG